MKLMLWIIRTVAVFPLEATPWFPVCTVPVLGLPAAAASLPGEVLIAPLMEERGILQFRAALLTGMNTPFGGEHTSEHGRPGLAAAECPGTDTTGRVCAATSAERRQGYHSKEQAGWR